MIKVNPPMFRGEKTTLAVGDVIEIAFSGTVCIRRSEERLKLPVSPLDSDMPDDQLVCARAFTLDGAANLAQLIVLGGGFSCRRVLDKKREGEGSYLFALAKPTYPSELTYGDVMEISRSSGQVSFLRGENLLQLEASCLTRSHQMAMSFAISPGLTVGHAAHLAKLVAMARKVQLKCTEDGTNSRFSLLDPDDKQHM